MVKYASEIIFTKDTPYLTREGELWDVFCEDLSENWLRYNGTALYFPNDKQITLDTDWYAIQYMILNCQLFLCVVSTWSSMSKLMISLIFLCSDHTRGLFY